MGIGELPGMPAVEGDGHEGLREQLRAAIAGDFARFETPPFGDMACSPARASAIAVNAVWPLIATRLAPAWPTSGEGLRRLRLPLEPFDADLLAVGDKFEEGGRYVQRIVQRSESDQWTVDQWTGVYDRLAVSWHARAARGDFPTG